MSIDEAVHVAVSAASSCDTETRSAVESAFKAMTAKLGGQSSRVSSTVSKRASVGRPSRRISLIIVAFTCTHDADEVIETLHQLCPDVPVAGMTTCRGVVVNGTWSTHRKEYACGVWGLSDEAGDYAVGQVSTRGANFHTNIAAELKGLLSTRSGTPSFVLLLGSPGGEEDTLAAMRGVLDPSVPILGGSSADNKVQGEWRQVAKTGTTCFGANAPGGASTEGAVIVVAWSSCEVRS